MIRSAARDKSIPENIRRGLSRCAATALLSAAQMCGGLYGPWALGAAAVFGGGRGDLWAVLGAVAGALVFFDFQAGLRLAASAVLICCARMVFADTKVGAKPLFTPLLAGVSLLAVQAVYLAGRAPSQWALGAAAGVMAAAVACGLSQQSSGRQWRLLTVMTAAVAALSALRVEGYSPGSVAAAWLSLLWSGVSPPAAAAIGSAMGACVDLAAKTPTVLWAAVCAVGALAASLTKKWPRLLRGLVFCLCGAAVPLALDADRPWTALYQAAVAALGYALTPLKWLDDLTWSEERPRAVPAAATQNDSKARAAAFQELYNAMFRSRPAEQGENPAVIFDHAAEQTCRNCVLAKRCWQTEYNATYNAFNDACGAMLKRGRAETEDFPLFFTSRCIRFPELLSAVNTELYAFRLRRQYRTRLEDTRQLAEEQYRHLGEAPEDDAPSVPEGALLRCRVGTLLRPKEGETQCGDQLAVFTGASTLYMLLSDGMGSGAAAHAESAMTVRLLRQFLKAGVHPTTALKTINNAMTLRCQEGGGFTTIDLLALDRRTGAATLYKYGAAASYVKRGDTVSRLEGGSLPAGLQAVRTPPEATGFQLEAGSVLVMVSDGVTGQGDDWLRELLRQWPGGDSQALAQMILAESRRHGGLRDDCAVLALRLEKSENLTEKRV